ncbi:head-tail connector protein [Microvirga makkahensis]|uniref:Uncharacterized protein n=1 Tax=Microvirga makkahensis TaxID=1128670 RepID=A0A7X3MSR2_9HYPH|nr:hypothetical protein [Microvirga makkahensis]
MAAELIVPLNEAKEHLRPDHPDDDAYLTTLIGAATAATHRHPLC